MNKIIMKILVILFLFYFHSPLFAEKLTCPSVAEIKAVQLIKAFPDRHDPDLWYFLSTSFVHDGIEWNVSFGTFFPEIKSSEEALKQGQAYFNQSPLLIRHPHPVQIPKNILFCDYMPTGRDYFISASSPPEYSGYRIP